jgi:steroid delta-isomerase-like uncharacterized protein
MATTQVLTEAELKETVLGLLGALNAHDVDAALTFFTEDATWEGSHTPKPVIGHDAIREIFRAWFTGFSDMHFPLEDVELYLETDGRHGIAYWTMIMTMDGPYAGFAPTGRTAKSKGMCRYEFRDGKIGHHVTIHDEMAVTQQLGLLPTEDSLRYRLMAGAQRLTSPITRRLARM